MVLCPQHHRRVSSCYRYATDAAAAGITVVTSRMSPGLRFADRAEAEAVAAAWAALAHGRRAGDEGRHATSISLSRTRVREYYFAVDFGWRAATLDHFFAAAGRSTFSALAHVSVAGEGIDMPCAQPRAGRLVAGEEALAGCGHGVGSGLQGRLLRVGEPGCCHGCAGLLVVKRCGSRAEADV